MPPKGGGIYFPIFDFAPLPAVGAAVPGGPSLDYHSVFPTRRKGRRPKEVLWSMTTSAHSPVRRRTFVNRRKGRTPCRPVPPITAPAPIKGLRLRRIFDYSPQNFAAKPFSGDDAFVFAVISLHRARADVVIGPYNEFSRFNITFRLLHRPKYTPYGPPPTAARPQFSSPAPTKRFAAAPHIKSFAAKFRGEYRFRGWHVNLG